MRVHGGVEHGKGARFARVPLDGTGKASSASATGGGDEEANCGGSGAAMEKVILGSWSAEVRAWRWRSFSSLVASFLAAFLLTRASDAMARSWDSEDDIVWKIERL